MEKTSEKPVKVCDEQIVKNIPTVYFRPTGPVVAQTEPIRKPNKFALLCRLALASINNAIRISYRTIKTPRMAAIVSSLSIALIMHIAVMGVSAGTKKFVESGLLLMGAGGEGTQTPQGFQGACDASIGATCIAYYSAFGCATAAYSGNVIDVVDAATNVTTGTRLQCSGGVVSAVVSGSACTFVTGNACSPLATTCATSCLFVTIYNQMGTGTLPNLIQPGSFSNSLIVTLSALNSKACLSNNGSQTAQSPVIGTVNQPFTYAAVAERTANFTSLGRIIASAAGGSNIAFRNATNTFGASGGTAVTETANDSVFHALVGIINGASTLPVVDGVPGTPGAGGAGTITADLEITSDSNSGPGGSNMTGLLCEAVIYSSALNSTQYAAYNSNTRLANRWGSSF